MKKFISFALAASMALSMVPATAFAASDLTTSHSSIRVTPDTEFYPQAEADADPSITYREVPYIQLEATTNFRYDKQEFELALENAEWLETVDDGDVLYIESEQYMNGTDGIKFTPAGSSSTGDGTTDTTVSVFQAMKNYTAAAEALKTAEDNYNAAVQGNVNYTNLKNALDKAQADLEAAEAAVAANSATIEDLEKQIASGDSAAGSYEQAVAQRATTAYKNDLALVTKANSPTIYDPASSDFYSAADIDPSSSAAASGFQYVEVADGYASDSSAVVTGSNSVVSYYELTDAALAEYNSAITEDTSHTAYASNAIVLAATDLVDGTKDTVELSWTTLQAEIKKLAEGQASKLQLTAEGERANTTIAGKCSNVSTAIANLTKIEEQIAALEGGADADYIAGLKVKLEQEKAKTAGLVSAQADAQTAYDTAKAAFDAANVGDLATVAAALETARTNRINAGVAYITANLNVGNDMTHSITWLNTEDGKAGITAKSDWEAEFNKVRSTVAGSYNGVNGTTLNVTITKKSDSRIVVTTEGYTFQDGDVLEIPLFVRTTGGIATVSIDSLDSEFTSEGKTFAQTSDGDTELSIEKVQNFYDDDEIKNIFLEELVPGTLEPGKYISLRMGGDFKFKADTTNGVKVTRITGNNGELNETLQVYQKDGNNRYVPFNPKDEADEIYIYVDGSPSTRAVQYRIEGLRVIEDGADFGDEATITVSGAGTTKQTITIGNYEDYGVTMKAEDKDLPVIYAGTKASSRNDNQTLKVTIEETVANSFIDNRKMEIKLPEGVEFANDTSDDPSAVNDIDSFVEDFKVYNFAGSATEVKNAMEVNDNGDTITINGKDLPEASGTNKDKKRKIEFSVHVSADAAFTGDVVMTLSGAGVANQEISATVATVKAPIEVKTDVNELIIDYRNTNIADITLVEPEAGLWAKDDVIVLEGEYMDFEDGAKAEVVNGDMSLKKLDGDNIEIDGGTLKIQVDSRSSKTPAEIKLSGLSLYMNRSLAAGDYKLKVSGSTNNEFFMNNYDKDGDDYNNFFETEKVTVMTDFVRIVTAGRDQDDSTFTTQIRVPVGSDVIYAGTKEIKLSEMEGGACPPAYINADGYTMLPVRAVVEALNGIAVVRWDDTTKTCTISFGSRIFSMTAGSKVLNMNGVGTALNAAPEIKDGRVFLPLRDLGYALGLSDNQITWDATTNTATLN